MSQFRAAWWCRNRHLQTIWGPLFRRQPLALTRERLVLPDGDFVDLDWLDTAADRPPAVTRAGVRPRGLAARLLGAAGAIAVDLHGAAAADPRGIGGIAPRASAHLAPFRLRLAAGASRAVAVPGEEAGGGSRAGAAAPAVPRATSTSAPAPVLLVLHGLEGSSSSHYVRGLLAGARARGWRGVALNFRSCSGEMNRLPRFYHSGDTADLEAVVRRLIEREPGARLGIVGISLGANVLLKWLGEHGAEAPAAVAGGVGISVPFDLAACARVLDRGFGKHVYTRNFLRTMRRKVVDKAAAHPGYVDVAAAQRARTFAAYDRAVTAPLFGFADERDYWRRASCRPFLAAIARPVLVINAVDDPFVPADALPAPAEVAPAVRILLTPRGGHVGFVDGRWPWQADSWAERRALDFLDARLRD
jgi:predicted alpha/beta-fold hydrolase